MCVDDSKNAHLILRELLASLRIKKVHFFVEPDSAFRMLKVNKPDIVIIDLVLEAEDGHELIRLIRRDENSANPYVPILVLTSHTDEQQILRARDAGATEVLRKPISLKSLYDRLIWMIEKPRPFIRAEGYVGPDRRRKMREFTGSEKRMTAVRADHQPEEPGGESEAAKS